MTHCTPLGSHPDVNKDQVPRWLMIFNIVVLALTVVAMFERVKIATGLFFLAISLDIIAKLWFNYKSYSKLGLIMDLIYVVVVLSLGIYFIFNP